MSMYAMDGSDPRSPIPTTGNSIPLWMRDQPGETGYVSPVRRASGMGGYLGSMMQNPQMMQMLRQQRQQQQGGMGGQQQYGPQALARRQQPPSGIVNFSPEQQRAIMAEAAQRGLGVNSSAESWQQGSDPQALARRQQMQQQMMQQQMMQQAQGMGGQFGQNQAMGNPAFQQPNWGQMFGPMQQQYQQRADQSAGIQQQGGPIRQIARGVGNFLGGFGRR